jgi:hypothetical protein
VLPIYPLALSILNKSPTNTKKISNITMSQHNLLVDLNLSNVYCMALFLCTRFYLAFSALLLTFFNRSAYVIICVLMSCAYKFILSATKMTFSSMLSISASFYSNFAINSFSYSVISLNASSSSSTSLYYSALSKTPLVDLMILWSSMSKLDLALIPYLPNSYAF